MSNMKLCVLAVVLACQQVGAISCDSDGSCPWYTFATCCNNVCWFGSQLTQCQSLECTVCRELANKIRKDPLLPSKKSPKTYCRSAGSGWCSALGGGFMPFRYICQSWVSGMCRKIIDEGADSVDYLCDSPCGGSKTTSFITFESEGCDNCLEEFNAEGGCRAIGDFPFDRAAVTSAISEECQDILRSDSCWARVGHFCDSARDQDGGELSKAETQAVLQNVVNEVKLLEEGELPSKRKQLKSMKKDAGAVKQALKRFIKRVLEKMEN